MDEAGIMTLAENLVATIFDQVSHSLSLENLFISQLISEWAAKVLQLWHVAITLSMLGNATSRKHPNWACARFSGTAQQVFQHTSAHSNKSNKASNSESNSEHAKKLPSQLCSEGPDQDSSSHNQQAY